MYESPESTPEESRQDHDADRDDNPELSEVNQGSEKLREIALESMSQESELKTVNRLDYKPPVYLIPEVNLTFELDPENTVVTNRSQYQRGEGVSADEPLVLAGEGLKLLEVSINGRKLDASEYQQTEEGLRIENLPDSFELETKVAFNPEANKSGMGLYKSGEVFCTQMEAEGFRKVTFAPDRPDVMSHYITTVVADRSKYPHLLSNGNMIDEGTLSDGRDYTVWDDPFDKPSYLFAVVAGEFDLLTDTYTTASGKKVAIELYVDPGAADRAEYALEAISKSMKWDEDRFGLEYDLDKFMVVAVDSFNAGAMENKGLNIFNSAYVLADEETATDDDFQGIEAVIGHEYFHNWTGDRVTCRDWFQLTLKEGLTVFRDQEFTSDLNSREVKRIDDADGIRSGQFAEDSGPNAHPIRPDSYAEIDNFYTWTVYEKGAEVIRMIHTLIGEDAFQEGMKKYFELYDGQAVTCDDFINAMTIASGRDFGQFMNWYSQAGTPELEVATRYIPEDSAYELTVYQSCPPTPGQDEKEPFHIPLKVGLLDSEGNDIKLGSHSQQDDGSIVLEVTKPFQTFRFEGVTEEPVPSLLRDFSAPVKLYYDRSDEELAFLMANDTNSFARYDAAQTIARKELLGIVHSLQQGEEPAVGKKFIAAFGSVVKDEALDPAFKSRMLSLPSVGEIIEELPVADYKNVFAATKLVVETLAREYEGEFDAIFAKFTEELKGGELSEGEARGARELKNTALAYLNRLDTDEQRQHTFEQYSNAENMTDRMAALVALCRQPSPERDIALRDFHDHFKDNTLVMDKWLGVQASSPDSSTLETVKELEKHPAFDPFVPNKIYALIGGFAGNAKNFHDESGSGYKYVADKVIDIDKFNPNVAAGIATAFKKYGKLEPKQKALMKTELDRILGQPELNKGTKEIVSKTLASGSD